MLLLVNAHYAPDVAGSGQHLTDLAEHLVAAGIPVEVLTGTAGYNGGQLDAPRRELRRGVRIRRVATPACGRGTAIRRVFAYGVFSVRALWVVCARRDVSAVVLLTTPPLLGVIGWVGWLIRGRRYAIWSLDLHPEAAVAAGMLAADSPVTRVLTWTSNRAYRRADFVVDVGPYMKQRLLGKGVRASATYTIPVWALAEQTPPGPDAVRAMRARWRLEGKFVVLYAGNAGIVHDFSDVLDAMALLRDDPRLYFLFMGSGPRRREIETGARARGVGNFGYRDSVARSELSTVLALGDAHLVSLRSGFVGISAPGKVYGALATGRPVLFVGPARCEPADAVRAAPQGAVIDPADGCASQRIAATLRAWSEERGGDDVTRAIDRGAAWRNGDSTTSCRAFEHVLRHAWPDVAS